MKASPTLAILHQDDSLIAVDKPSGVATIPGRDNADSILHLLAEQIGLPAAGETDPRLRVVHRLDKDTSGVLLFAKTLAAQRFISEQFQNNLVRKEYLALVAGRPSDDSGVIDAPIAPHPTSPKRMTMSKRGRRALSEWTVEKRFRAFTLLRVFPKTGKTHQIRVHLSHIGFPLVIDPIYNEGASGGLLLSQFKRGYRTKSDETERPLIDRLTLHAHKLTFTAPKGESVTIESPLPKDFRAALNMLNKYGHG